MTFEEFLNHGEEGERYEWINGEVFLLPASSVRHQLLLGFLSSILYTYVQVKERGTVIYKFTLYLSAYPSARVPDILFIKTEYTARIRLNYLDGKADLVIEIASPETEDADRNAKFKEYERAGISEYWVVDEEERCAEFYQLNAQGVYEAVQPNSDGIYYSSAIAGLWIKTDWLRQPLPYQISIYKEWGLI